MANLSSPTDIAKQIFSTPARDPCSICIIPYSQVYDEDEASLNFEILITIYLEGLMNICEVLKQEYLEEHPHLNFNLNDSELYASIYNKITIDDLKFPNPWLKSFGFALCIDEYIQDPDLDPNLDTETDIHTVRYFNEHIKPKSYCRILLSFDPKDIYHFRRTNNHKLYTFILNGDYNPTNKLEDIFAILSKDDKMYRIGFRVYKL